MCQFKSKKNEIQNSSWYDYIKKKDLSGDKVIPESIKNILKTLENNGFEAYIVGGFVRDYLLKKKTNDFDIATNALPKDLIGIFGVPKRKIEYGSYHLKMENYDVDITTYRKEGEYQNNRPTEVTYSNNLVEDAKRRDFTMNALYMNERENIIDLYDGIKDINAKTIKMIGNPSVRLKEDPIRILRAVRFSVIYNFKLEKTLKNAIQKEKKNIEKIPLDKVKKELDAILLANGFFVLKKLGLLKELGITTTKIVYVEDLSGLWAQLNTTKEYVHEKSLKNNQKSINKIINCGTIKLLDLYHYGFYLCRVAATILHFPIKKLEKMESTMPIKSRRDIDITAEEIKAISGLENKELGILIQIIEEAIISLKLKNKKEEIIRFIKRR